MLFRSRRRSVRSTRTAAFLKMPARGDIEARGEENESATWRDGERGAERQSERRDVRSGAISAAFGTPIEARARDGAARRAATSSGSNAVVDAFDAGMMDRKTTKETGRRDAPEHAPPFGGCCATTSASDVIARATSTASGGAMRYRALGVAQSGARPRRAAPICMCPRQKT